MGRTALASPRQALDDRQDIDNNDHCYYYLRAITLVKLAFLGERLRSPAYPGGPSAGTRNCRRTQTPAGDPRGGDRAARTAAGGPGHSGGARPGGLPARPALLALLCVLANTRAEAGTPPEAAQAGTAPGGTRLTFLAPRDDPTPLLRLPAAPIAISAGGLGQRLFAADWLRDPPRPAVLGPDFDAAGCLACHVEGLPGAAAAASAPQPILRLLRGEDRARFGGQLSTAALPGRSPQGRLVLRWVETGGQLGDGTPYRLRRPLVRVRLGPGDDAAPTNDAAGSDQAGLGPVGLRMPPALFGWGLLEAIDETFLDDLADPDDRDGNGISGRVNLVPDRAQDHPRVGRFGWKAEQPSLLQQTAAALHNDMGITTSLFPDPACTGAYIGAGAAAGGAACPPELGDGDLALLVEHQRWLGVPERRRRDSPAGAAGPDAIR